MPSSVAPLTWKLWRALRFPDEGNPLYERVQGQAVELPGQRYWRRLSPLSGVLSSLLPALIVVVAPLALLLAANVLGALVAFNVMRVIQREREGHTYDLLALVPMGLGAANWQIAAACVQRLDAVERLAQVRTLAVITLVLLMFSVSREGVFAPLALLIGFAALNLDAIQSLIVGCLSGMLAQSVGERGSPFAALAIFAFVQLVAVYLPTFGAALFLLDFLRLFALDRQITTGIVATGALAALFVARVTIIRVMWRELERRLL